MPVDRFGNMIQIGWWPHEVLWCEAALTLPKPDRTAALIDIAEMSGRSLGSVKHKVWDIHARQKNLAAQAALAVSEAIAEQARLVALSKPVFETSIRMPTRSELMSGRSGALRRGGEMVVL